MSAPSTQFSEHSRDIIPSPAAWSSNDGTELPDEY
jgi:hypothetical protein